MSQKTRFLALALAFALICLLAFISCAQDGDDDDDDSESQDDDDDEPGTPWYKRVVFMEIFVRSFYDSDGDGIGDLNGLTEKLDHVADLGIGAVWLMPVYPTPYVDSGYDVADYCSINPDYGTMSDFERFLKRAHELGIKVFMDGVFNHTSDQHGWFLESRSSRESAKRDWYMWADEPEFDCRDPLSPGFGEERWTFDEATGQYYYHHFRPRMPDLNWENPEVRQAVLDVVRFWLDKGVDGFRLDVAHLYFEDQDYCYHHPKTHEFHRELRALVDQYGDRALAGEVAGYPWDVCDYLGSGSDELHMILNFPLNYGLVASMLVHNYIPTEAMLQLTYGTFPYGGWHGVHISNHDFYRYHSLFGGKDAATKAASALQLTLPGTAFVYYGEEVGMSSGKQVIVDYRDAARTPMHWDPGPNAGFTTGTPWIAMADNYGDHNVLVEEGDPGSLLNHFRRVIEIRNATPALQTGDYNFVGSGDFGAYVFFRGRGEGAVLVAVNLSENTVGLDLDLTHSPWDSLAGRVQDLYSGSEYYPLTPEVSVSYPLALEPYGFALLSMEP